MKEPHERPGTGSAEATSAIVSLACSAISRVGARTSTCGSRFGQRLSPVLSCAGNVPDTCSTYVA